ncbi:division/cell wall cluster transcriptional repressor MraZ [Inmirania thermothiophila]|uniref:division/cell wall cluster transcriptional repressor MraZ n=1 Tax=Inmirania thermothiophila TaxID=1750597 RepID=UPI000F4A7951|nr:division/cell wall cluster transcriptional repressor MraZ [Inmirania thermothiophila]
MFRGINALNLDAKGRLAIPARYREQLRERGEDQLVVTIDPNLGCLFLYPYGDWVELEREIMRMPSLQPMVRKLQLILVGHATECELDRQGRILVPPLLRSAAALDKRVVLIGQGKKLELWDESKWNETSSQWLSEGLGSPELGAALSQLAL